MTGFNRRFSPHTRFIQQIVAQRTNPMIANYRMNAGYIPLDHWVHGPHGGGRNLGEACHIYDLFTALTGSRYVQVSTQRIAPSTGYYSPRDNFVTLITFEDGSVATLTYTALGASSYPKERMEIFVEAVDH
jgi:predicted dehydrogenase